MALMHVKTKRWTVAQYKKMAEVGMFGPEERVELIEGEIVPMAAQNTPHSDCIIACNRLLIKRLDDTHTIGCQVPIDLTLWSEPEPDFVVVRHEHKQRGNPLTSADLIIEVAHSSVAYDRCEKASLYALAGIPEYWILNVRDGQLEVHRVPAANARAPFGHCYTDVRWLKNGEAIQPWCRPDVSFSVDELL